MDRDVFLVLSLPGTASHISATWEHILHLLRMIHEEDDMLVICHGEGHKGSGQGSVGIGEGGKKGKKRLGSSECGSRKAEKGAGDDRAGQACADTLLHLIFLGLVWGKD